jgi:NAD-dependent SIR2 family protein deacetylase
MKLLILDGDIDLSNQNYINLPDCFNCKNGNKLKPSTVFFGENCTPENNI